MTISAYVDATHSLRTRSHRKVWHLFLALVSCASLLPFVAIPFAQHVIPKTSSALFVVTALIFFGANFHVASTGWFYTDPTMRSYFRTRPLRYLVVPCFLIVASAAAFYFLDPSLSSYLLIPFFCWQLWHYQKQNVGLLSFVAAGTDGGPLSSWERRTLALSALSGMLGLFQLLDIGLPGLFSEFASLHRIGAAILCLLPIAFCLAVVKNPALRTNWLRLTFFLFGTLFFLPLFIFSDFASATLGYALGHGLQYLVFIGFVGAGKKNAIVSLATLLVVGTVGAVVLNAALLAPDWLASPSCRALFGAFYGAVMTHFVVDAGVWRLREAFQRSYMREKFYFVFSR
jgi:hypothetical protein